MIIQVKIENKIIELSLSEKEKILDTLTFAEDHDLASNLLPNIDSLLKKNNLRPKDIEKMKLKTDIAESYTSFRIAKAVEDAFNWAKAVDN